MRRWDEPHKQHEREWDRFEKQLKQTRLTLEQYVYDPYASFTNDPYNVDFWGNESEYETELFLLPAHFYTHPIEKLLAPLPPSELPILPSLPPLRPKSLPDHYKESSKREFYFKNPKWSEKAQTILARVDFEDQFVNFEEANLIKNLILTDEAIEIEKEIEQVRASTQGIFRLSMTTFESLRISLTKNLSIEDNCKLIELSHNRHYLPKALRKKFISVINPDSQTLIVQFEFKDYSSQQISYGKLKNGDLKFLTDTKKEVAIKRCLYSLIVRAGYLSSILNIGGHFQNIVINVEQNWHDKSTGRPRNGIIASVQGETKYFQELDLSKLDTEACFKSLKGLLTPSLNNANPIRPIFVINKEDERFVASKNIDDTLTTDSNLAAMDWDDFEHLVAQLFEWEFGRNGVDVKVTRASRDRGVDAILFDPDPLRGGKYVLQAKRYTRTVDVSSVRDLYGTVMNEGANRGILITTASFGPDSYQFAKDKPISLVDGANLLLMLQRHGKKFRIDLEEARALNNSNS
jgi:HJR/Mrr/RecB family endonuclease